MALNRFDPEYGMAADMARQIVKVSEERADAVAFKRRIEEAIPESYLRQPGSALNITLSELQVLWRARFGDAWVTSGELMRDDYYQIAVKRLHAAGQLERLTINQGHGMYDVYRIRDDDANR